jgi:transcription elongation factor GreA
MSNPQQFSPDAHGRLAAEFEDLTTRGRIDIARKIETARELGDLSENGDYHASKEEQGKMEGRILLLEALLLDAVIVEGPTGDGDTVTTGAVVTVLYDGDDDPEQLLVGSIEEQRDDLTVVSPRSPLGKALLGSAPGDEVSFETPVGTLTASVVSIDG